MEKHSWCPMKQAGLHYFDLYRSFLESQDKLADRALEDWTKRLGCVDISSQPYESINEMEEAEVPMRQLVESREDVSVVLDLADEALHKMTLSV